MSLWDNCVVLLLLVSGGLSGVSSQSCQLPAGLRGKNMTSNAAGPVTISDTSVVFHEGLRDCTAPLCQTFSSLTFDCMLNQDDQYFLRSQELVDGTNRLFLYICWYISAVSDQKWVYYQGPQKLDTFYNSYVLPRKDTITVTADQVCDLSSNPLPLDKYNVLLETDFLTLQSSPCPDGLLSTFVVTTSSTSCVTEFDVCSTDTRQTISVNDTSCRPDEFFTANGTMDCLHSLSQNDATYVYTFTPQNDTVTFSCLAYTKQGDDLYVNLQATTCDGLNEPTSTSNDAFFQATVLCPFPCVFPTAFSGNWVNSRTAGAVSATSTTLNNFFTCSDPPCSAAVTSLECYRTENDNYLLRTPVTTISNQTVRVYVCMELSQVTSTKYLYYLLHTNVDTTLNDYAVIFNSGQSVLLSQACDNLSAAPYKGTRHHLFVKSGSVASSFSACPSGMLGEFNNTDVTCQSTYNTCDNDTQLTVTGTACSPKPFYSESGSVGCLYSLTVSGTTYLTVYNNDGSPDGTNTFAFTCVAMQVDGTAVHLSQNPLECSDNQTYNSISTTSGGLFVYSKTGDCPDPPVESSGLDIIIIIIIVLVVLVVLIIIIIIICIICRKKQKARRTKDNEEAGAILDKEEEDDDHSGYPHSSRGADSRVGRGRGSRGLGTPRSHIADVYEVAEEEGPKQVNVVPHRRRQRRRGEFEPTGKDGTDGARQGEGYETDGEEDYSDDSWEEYVDEEGNAQVKPKRRRRRRRRQRRRKKVKQTYTRTRVLEDGTTVEEEVESEFSVTASSDVTSSDEDDRESLTDQIRQEKERRKARLQQIMEGSVPAVSHIITRDMDEKKRQPEKKRRSLWNKLRLKAQNRKSRTRVRNQVKFQSGKGEVAGIAPEEHEIPYLVQFQKKKDIERVLNDEGFFDDPTDKMTSETVFGFQNSERELSPKPGQFAADGQAEDERMVSATDSSQLDGESRSHGTSGTINEYLMEGQGTTKVMSKDKDKRVTIDPLPPSPAQSSDSEIKDDDSERKTSDTSSGVADLSPSHQPSSPEHNQPSVSDASKENRRVSLGWEKVQGLYGRHRLTLHTGGSKDRSSTASRHGPSKTKEKQDKRVKTALRRLLNERLFGSSDKKKSRRDDVDTWTNADSVANNVSDTSSTFGTRVGTRQTSRPVTNGKVAFAEVDPNQRGSRKLNDHSPHRQLRLSVQQIGDSNDETENEENGNNGQERLPTRGSKLPPLRTPTMALDRVFTPANYPKWGLCVTASQRSMLVDGLERDRTFLSRQKAQTAWSSKTDDSMILPPKPRENGAQEDTTDDESYLDPHRPDTESHAGSRENDGGPPWAHKRRPHTRTNEDSSVAFTNSSGRSPLDIDDRRLRKLLEELYKDKKFMDKLINKIDEEHLEFPDHIAAEDVKFLSEFGRHYLLERAEYWDVHGPLGHPRPPPTALGMRLNRAQTSMTSDGSRNSSEESMTSQRPKTVR